MNTSERNCWDGNSHLLWCLLERLLVTLNIFVLLNLFEQWEYLKSSIQPRSKWYLTCCYIKDQIFMFLTQKIRFSMLKLMILDPKILIEVPERILLIPWSILIPCHLHYPGSLRKLTKTIYLLNTYYHFPNSLAFESIWPYHIWSSKRPCQVTFLFLEQMTHSSFVKMGWSISQLMKFISFFAKFDFWMKFGMYFDKSWIGHVSMHPRWIFLDLNLSGGIFCHISR